MPERAFNFGIDQFESGPNFGAEPALDTENNPESAVEVLENARGERRKLLSGILESRAAKFLKSPAADTALNYIPGVDIVKLSIEAALAKTSSGTNLSNRDRLVYAAIAGSTLLSYGLLLAGLKHEAIVARGSASSISAVKFGPGILRQGAAVAKKILQASSQKLLLAMDRSVQPEQSEKFYNILNLELGNAAN